MAVFAAAILALVLVYLSLRVVKLRKRHLVAIGDGGHVDLQRAIRAQGNFTEYVPMALLLLYGLEQMQMADWLVGILSLMLVVGRLLHAWSISQLKENFRIRFVGMALTFASLVVSALTIMAVSMVRFLS